MSAYNARHCFVCGRPIQWWAYERDICYGCALSPQQLDALWERNGAYKLDDARIEQRRRFDGWRDKQNSETTCPCPRCRRTKE